MARERMVTRTVEVSTISVMCLDTVTCDVSVRNFGMSGRYDDSKVALKDVRKEYETDTFKCVAVQNITVNEVLYGMREVDFIRMAKVLDPETRKAIEE